MNNIKYIKTNIYIKLITSTISTAIIVSNIEFVRMIYKVVNTQ